MKRSTFKRWPYKHIDTVKLEDGEFADEFWHTGTGERFQVFKSKNVFRRAKSENSPWGPSEGLEFEKRNLTLESHAVIIRSRIDTALTAIATKQYLDWQFFGRDLNERQKLFFTNIANTLPYIANNALIESSVIGIVEEIKSQSKIRKLNSELPNLEKRKSDPIDQAFSRTVPFTEERFQDLFDADPNYTDPTALSLWRISRTLEADLSKTGPNTIPKTKISISPGTCEMIHAALLASQKNDVAVPSVAEIRDAVIQNFQRYEEWIRKKEA